MRLLMVLPVFALIAPLSVVCSQEPAYFRGQQVVRYVEGPDLYHYVRRCDILAEFIPTFNPAHPPGPMEHALCWEVGVARLHPVNGKLEVSGYAAGYLQISAHNLRFLPYSDQDQNLYFNLLPAEAKFLSANHVTMVSDNRGLYATLAFRNACLTCTPGKPTPALTNLAQLDSEFRFLEEASRHYEAAYKKISDLAQMMRVGVFPANQPTLDDVHDAMALYAALNRKLAPFCSDPDRSCVLKYADYQACKADSSSAACAEPPSCSAFCAMNYADIEAIHGRPCTAPNQDSASLAPDWTDVVKKMEAARIARGPVDLKTLKVQQIPPGTPPTDFMGKPLSSGCTVEASYAMAMMFSMTGHPSTPQPQPDLLLPNGHLQVAGATMAGRILTKTPPIYPPIARAAHVSGTVTLHATISPEGEIQDLQVTSGPDMLKAAAVDAVSTWKYQPTLSAGKPVTVETDILVDFNFGKG